MRVGLDDVAGRYTVPVGARGRGAGEVGVHERRRGFGVPRGRQCGNQSFTTSSIH